MASAGHATFFSSEAERAAIVESIARRYLAQTGSDAELALRRAIADRLADLTEMERCLHAVGQLVSRGFVRGALDQAS